MKIIEYKAGEHRYNRQACVEIYPYIEQDDSTVIDDPEDEFHGEEMGNVVAYATHVELNYGWEDMPSWNVDMAEKFGHALLKAVEFSRQLQA